MQDNTVILGVTDLTRLVLDEEFPELKKVNIVPYQISYAKNHRQWLKLLMDAPRIFRVIAAEHAQLNAIVKQHNIDMVISDNRFGLYHQKVPGIYITHQLHIRAGLFSGIANAIHNYYLKRYQQVWVPDYEDRNLSLAGDLSRPLDFKPVKYIGPLSRLSFNEAITKEYKYLCLLSGPEPQRSILEAALAKAMQGFSEKACVVRGTTGKMQVAFPDQVKVIDMADAAGLSGLIASSETIVCRSGYSTLMDLHCLKNTKCVLIPTPGQGEQEYLAEYWHQKFGARVWNQHESDQFHFS